MDTSELMEEPRFLKEVELGDSRQIQDWSTESNSVDSVTWTPTLMADDNKDQKHKN